MHLLTSDKGHDLCALTWSCPRWYPGHPGPGGLWRPGGDRSPAWHRGCHSDSQNRMPPVVEAVRSRSWLPLLGQWDFRLQNHQRITYRYFCTWKLKIHKKKYLWIELIKDIASTSTLCTSNRSAEFNCHLFRYSAWYSEKFCQTKHYSIISDTILYTYWLGSRTTAVFVLLEDGSVAQSLASTLLCQTITF